jgi:hypothetical protein
MYRHIESVRFAKKSWLKILFINLLWEKNTVLTEKKTSWNVRIVWLCLSVSFSTDKQTRTREALPLALLPLSTVPPKWFHKSVWRKPAGTIIPGPGGNKCRRSICFKGGCSWGAETDLSPLLTVPPRDMDTKSQSCGATHTRVYTVSTHTQSCLVRGPKPSKFPLIPI